MSKKVQQAYERIVKFALELPEAWEDHPWGDQAIKVRKKIFLFPGITKKRPIALKLSMKLPASCTEVLRHDWATPTGYGLGRSGWVSMSLTAKDLPSQSRIEDWVEESYQAVAPKRLAALLDADLDD